MKRKLICAIMAMLALMSVTACDGDSSTTDSAANNTTKQTTTTKETTKARIKISKSQAESIAESRIKSKYSQYSPVVIGSVVAHEGLDYWEVVVKGHYWKTNAYGHNAGSQNFTDRVVVDYYA